MKIHILSHRVVVTLVAVLIFSGILAGVSPPVLAAPAGSVIKTAHAIKCIDMPGYTHEVGAHAIQWDCHGGVNQRFRFYPKHAPGTPGLYVIQNVDSGYCLQMQGNEGGATAGHIDQFFCPGGGSRNNLWSVKYDGKDSNGHYYRFHMQGLDGHQMCMDVDHASKENGALIIGWYCNNKLNQRFLSDIKLDHD